MGLLLLLSLLLVLEVVQTIVAVTVVAKFPWDGIEEIKNII